VMARRIFPRRPCREGDPVTCMTALEMLDRGAFVRRAAW
jgi:hypothetical protein